MHLLRLGWQESRAALLGVCFLMAVQAALGPGELILVMHLLQAHRRIFGDLIGLGGLWVLALVAPKALSAVREPMEASVWVRVLELAYRNALLRPLVDLYDAEVFDRLRWAESQSRRMIGQTLSLSTALVVSVLTVAGLLGTIAAINVWLCLALSISVIPVAMSGRFRGRIERDLWEKSAGLGRDADYAMQVLFKRATASEVRLLGFEPVLLRRWSMRMGELSAEKGRATWRMAQANVLSQCVPHIANAIVLCILVAGVQKGISVASTVAIVWSVQIFYRAVNTLAMGVGHLSQIIVPVVALLDLQPPAEPNVPVSPEDGSTTVASLVNVSFRYPGSDREAVQGVTLDVRQGERLAIVGENGSGKTTLLWVLLGLLPPSDGEVRWRHGQPPSAVLQSYNKYQLTVRENIGLSDVGRLQDGSSLSAAASAYGASSVVDGLPERYETRLGAGLWDSGVELSEGQWQRLAIARGAFPARYLWVCDEPTASVDAETEVAVYQNICEHGRQDAVVFSTHRLGAARLADRIVVLGKEGRVVGIGVHGELMNTCKEYRALFEAQRALYSVAQQPTGY